MQRRAFWVSYTIDRSAAFSLGRPFGIADSDITAELPMDIDDANITATGLTCEPRRDNRSPPTCVSAAIHGIEMRRIWTDIQQLASVTDLRHDSSQADSTSYVKARLQQWLIDRPMAPAQNGSPAVNFGSDNWFHLSYHHAVLLMHRRRLTASTSTSDLILDSATEDVYLECADSASSICTIYRSFYLQSPAIYAGWGALHVLFVAGLTFLHCLASSQAVRETYRSQASSVCTSCTIVLVIMAERWPAVQPYRDMFTLLSEKMQSVLVQPAADSAGALMPLLQGDHVTDKIQGISALGMCDSVRGLLSDMVD
jgi:hypothetical protein